MPLTRSRIAVIGAVVLLGVAVLAGLSLAGPGADERERSGSEAGALQDAFESADGNSLGTLSSREQDAQYNPAELAPPPGAGEALDESPGSAPAGDGSFQLLLDRKIVQSTSVDLEVEEVSRDFQDIIRIAEINGGFVARSSFSSIDNGQVADLTIRVPADRYQAVLAEIRSMGDVVTESSDSTDATEEYTDLEARLRTLEATEQRYLELLARADNVNDILVVQDRLDGVRAQIEQVVGRINLLDNLVDLTTITVHLRPVAFGAGTSGAGSDIDPLNAAANAWERSLDSLRRLAAAALVVVAFSWWLVPPLAALAFGARWFVRRPRAASGGPVA